MEGINRALEYRAKVKRAMRFEFSEPFLHKIYLFTSVPDMGGAVIQTDPYNQIATLVEPLFNLEQGLLKGYFDDA